MKSILDQNYAKFSEQMTLMLKLLCNELFMINLITNKQEEYILAVFLTADNWIYVVHSARTVLLAVWPLAAIVRFVCVIQVVDRTASWAMLSSHLMYL
jgi:hypothetical protein